MYIESEDGKTITVYREGGPKIYRESTFFRHLARALNALVPNQCVCKLMVKDGHLTDSDRHYIRERKWVWAIVWNYHAIREVYEDYNREGSVVLTVEWSEDWRKEERDV